MAKATSRPIPVPPTTASTNSPAARIGSKVLTIASTAVFSATSAVASFNRLSPSMTEPRSRGAVCVVSPR